MVRSLCQRQTCRRGGLTADAEHHADGGLPDRVPGHALVAACVRGPHVVDGQEALRTYVKLPALRHLHPVLEENTADTTPGMTWKQRVFVLGGGALSVGVPRLPASQIHPELGKRD